MPRLVVVLSIAVAFGVVSVRSVCLAQSTAAPGASSVKAGEQAAEPAGYKAAVDTAIEEFMHGNFAESREYFARAQAIFPNARAMRGLGMSEFELRNYVESVSWLEQALSSHVKPLSDDLRKETSALLARAKTYVGEVVLHLKPEASAVRVDGIPAQASAEQRLRLAVGDHVLDFSAEGHIGERRSLIVRGEQLIDLEVKLTPIAADKPAPLAVVNDQPKVDSRTPVYKRWWLWTAVGAVVAGGIVAGVLLANRDPEVRAANGGSTNDTFTLH